MAVIWPKITAVSRFGQTLAQKWVENLKRPVRPFQFVVRLSVLGWAPVTRAMIACHSRDSSGCPSLSLSYHPHFALESWWALECTGQQT